MSVDASPRPPGPPPFALGTIEAITHFGRRFDVRLEDGRTVSARREGQIAEYALPLARGRRVLVRLSVLSEGRGYVVGLA